MALAKYELLWIKQSIYELKFVKTSQMKLLCDNQAALHIISYPMFHERIKHIEIYCHFIWEKALSSWIVTSYINSNDQQADILTRSLKDPPINFICNKLGAYDLYTPTWGEVLGYL